MKRKYMAPLAEILELEIDKTVCNNDIIDESAVDPDDKDWSNGWV